MILLVSALTLLALVSLDETCESEVLLELESQLLPINLVYLINQRLPRSDKDLYQESDVLPHVKNISGAAWNCRDKSLNTNIQILASHNSPLCDIDWNALPLAQWASREASLVQCMWVLVEDKGNTCKLYPSTCSAESDEYEDHRVSRMKSISINKNKEVKLLKRKQKSDNIVVASGVPDYNQGFRKMIDEDTSNRSSSGSAISNLESCAQFSSADASELTGPSQSMVWDTTVPSRKRTFVNRPKPSPVEKLTKDLCSILHEQWSSYFSTFREWNANGFC
ncbi:hypothetical protein I3760_12G046300 [Carya illinoinensis]|nr:hypothetical protein I3760_12G046300 [Carya illinoinensis]